MTAMTQANEPIAAAQDRRKDDRQAQLWACLQSVTDPELDESVVDLNFITSADVDPMNRVHIGFRLPTYWCAANFSFLMADDMRRAVSALECLDEKRLTQIIQVTISLGAEGLLKR